MDKIRILIADNHLVVRQGIVLLLRQEPDFEIVGEASDGAEAVNMIFDRVPHIAILSWKMPHKDGLQAAKEIKHYMSSVKTLILTAIPENNRALDALANDVDGFVHKSISAKDFGSSPVEMPTGPSRESASYGPFARTYGSPI